MLSLLDEETAMQDDAVADESGLEPEDIKLVMSHVSCPRSTAVSGLRANNNDIIKSHHHAVRFG